MYMPDRELQKCIAVTFQDNERNGPMKGFLDDLMGKDILIVL